MKKRNNKLSSGTGAMLAALACLFLLLLLCAACTQEGGVPGTAGGNPPAGGEDDPQAGTELVVGSVSIGTTAPDAAGGQTRAATPVALTSGSIGIGVRAENGYTAQQAKYTYNSTTGKWEPDGPGIPLKSGAASLYAWYPYELNNDGDSQVTLELQAFPTEEALNQKALYHSMSGGSNVCVASPSAQFEMKPVYARIKMTVSGLYKSPYGLYIGAFNPDTHGGDPYHIIKKTTQDLLTGSINTDINNSAVELAAEDMLAVTSPNFAWNGTAETYILMIPYTDPITDIAVSMVDISTVIYPEDVIAWMFLLDDAQITPEAGKSYTLTIRIDGGITSIPTVVEENYDVQAIKNIYLP